jgi:hypothetical protein
MEHKSMMAKLKSLYRRAVVTDNPLMLLVSNMRSPRRYTRRVVYDQAFGKIPFISKSSPAQPVGAPVDRETVDRAVSTLRSRGVVSLPGHFAELAAKIRAEYAKPESEYEPVNAYYRTFFGPTGSSLITDLSLDENMLSIAAEYMGCQPYLRHGAALAILKSIDTTVPEYGVFNGLEDWPWHIDTPNLLSFHVIMNDLTEEDTHMRYAVGSHRVNRAASGIRSEELMTGRHEIYPCCGPAGTVYIFDNNGFHRPHAVGNSMRMTFEFYFTPGNQIFSMQQMRNIVESDAARGKRDKQFNGVGMFDEIEIPESFSPIQRESLMKIIEKTKQEEASSQA